MKILHVVGARPNFMKIAPIMHAMVREPDRFAQILVHTGQHYDANMSQVFFDELELPRPDVNLEVGSGSHAQQTALIMQRCEPVVLDYQPDGVIVARGVNSTVACVWMASKLGAGFHPTPSFPLPASGGKAGRENIYNVYARFYAWGFVS